MHIVAADSTILSNHTGLSNQYPINQLYFGDYMWHINCDYTMLKEVGMRSIKVIIPLLIVLSIVYAEETEINGDVLTVERIAEPVSTVAIVRVQLRLQNRTTLSVDLCPPWYLDHDIAPGDELTVTGEIVDDDMLIARAMTHHDTHYELRTNDFEPLWLRTRLQTMNQFYNPLKEKQISGTIEDIFIDKHTSIIESSVRTEDGALVRVQLAPDWYLQNRVRLGDEIEARGSEAGSSGQTVLLTREMRVLRTNTEIALRDRQGFPDWCGKGEYYNKKQNLPPYCQDDKEGRGKIQN